jgi:hypothetical protein
MLTVARNSIDLTAALVNDNSPPEVFTAAVRVGYDVEQFYGNLSAMLTRLRPNGELGIGFPMEHLGVTAAVSEMLLQSHELETGLLRFFPGVRKNETVSFAKLRTNGESVSLRVLIFKNIWPRFDAAHSSKCRL